MNIRTLREGLQFTPVPTGRSENYDASLIDVVSQH